MLPWSAFAWKAAPTLATAIEFTHRFGAILVLAVAGLFAAAVESGVRCLPSREGVRSLTVVMLVALLAISSGALTWRADWWWVQGLRSRAMYAYDELCKMWISCITPMFLAIVRRPSQHSLGRNRALTLPDAFLSSVATRR